METELAKQVPGLDGVVTEYSVGYLQHAATQYVEQEAGQASPLEEAVEAVTALLVSASGDFSAKNEALALVMDRLSWCNRRRVGQFHTDSVFLCQFFVFEDGCGTSLGCLFSLSPPLPLPCPWESYPQYTLRATRAHVIT